MIVAALLALQVAITGSSLQASAAKPQNRKYPGSGPCSTTLRHCINNVPTRSTIRIATNTPIKEAIEIHKSLTLKAAAGFDPVLIAKEQIHRFFVESETGSGPLHVTLKGLTFKNSTVQVDFDNGWGHSFELSNSTILHSNTDVAEAGLGISFERSTSVVVRRNLFKTVNSAIDVGSSLPQGHSELDIEGNSITSPIDDEGGSGIAVSAEIAGTVTTNIYSNLIYNETGCYCGGAAGIDFRTDASVNATANIVHNTIDDLPTVSDGIQVVTYSPSTAETIANIFNNIVTNSLGRGMYLPPYSALTTIRNGNNDFYQNDDPNDYGGYSAGPNTISANPSYVSAATRDYHPMSGSPVEAQGQICSPGGISRTDAEGFDRVDGYTTSMGAYETTDSPPPPGVLLVGTGGDDVLSGGPGEDVLCGMDGDDTLTGLADDDVAFGGKGADEVRGGASNDYVSGDDGADFIYGGTGDDFMYGGNDFDTIEGHDGVEGNDYLNGGNGQDDCEPDPNDAYEFC